MILYSPSGGGKSTLLCKLLKKPQIFDTSFDRIILYYQQWNDIYEQFTNKIEFVRGEVDSQVESELNNKQEKLLIADDQVCSKKSIETLSKLCVYGRHMRLSIVLLVQDLFISRHLRTVSLNTQVFIVFKHDRDVTSVSALFSQLNFPTKDLKKIYELATRKPYSYLCINLQQNVPIELRFSSNITGEYPVYYVQSSSIPQSGPVIVKWKKSSRD
jgi:hypothetical protein